MEFQFKKKLGQNFLTNKAIVKKIINCACCCDNSLIIEVGSGSGNLTFPMADFYKKAKVLSYEIDDELKDYLLSKKEEHCNIEFLFKDFLKSNLKEDVCRFKYSKLYFVSNVPYYITSPIIFKLIESGLEFEKIVILLQKEVGERITSKPCNRSYGAISVILNYFYEVKKEFLVDKNQFVPRPKVDSMVISFKQKRICDIDKDKFIKLVHDSFQYKRKTLKNNLKGYDLDKIEVVLKKFGYDLGVRAEELDYAVFVEIVNALA